jgi:hypothetical protein
MKGYVRTEELNVRKLNAGGIVILYDKDILEICTLQHIDSSGSWTVMGQTFDQLVVPARAELCKLVILTDSGAYPLKFSQWDKAIKNGEVNKDKLVTFELTPVTKYKEGKYIKTCTTCSSQFMGGRGQGPCRKCSDADVTAQIKIEKKVKPKRPRMISPQKNKEIALNAFQHGRDGLAIEEFVKWLENQF